MRAEILAVGTELLLGQIIDTNSSYISEQLAGAGIDCYFQCRVGDNVERIEEALRAALSRSDAVIVCGGLGPTHDDLTRDAVALTMGTPLEQDAEALRLLKEMFSRRNRVMTDNNLRQADVPVGARIIPQVIGTAPGLICPIGDKVIYVVPGVPDEMREMMARAVMPDLVSRSGETTVIGSRVLRTWGFGESRLAEELSSRIEELDKMARNDDPRESKEWRAGTPTIAFLASGIEGIKVRVTLRARDEQAARVALDDEETVLRSILGDIVFGVDDQTMEYAVGALLSERGLTLSVAESFTGGLMASRIVAVPQASRWFVGSVVSYASSTKHDLLGVPEGPVVTLDAAAAMAEGVRRLFSSDVAIATTGVAGPDSQEGLAPGTAFVGLAFSGEKSQAVALNIGGGRNNVRSIATISALDALRRRLLGRPALV